MPNPRSKKSSAVRPTPKKQSSKKLSSKKPAGRKSAAPRKRGPAEIPSDSKAAVVKRARSGTGGAARAAAAVGAKKFAIDAARLMSDLHCDNVVIFDTQGKSDVMDFVVIASGTSDRQMRSVADDLRELAKAQNMGVYGKELDERTTWVVIDLVEVVIHLFEPQARAYYDLEMMWGDCPQVKWKR